MNASNLEYRHQTLLHVLLVGMALLTYVAYPDDIVWALVRHHSNSHLLERLTFGAGAIVMFGAAVLETCATAYSQIGAASSGTVFTSRKSDRSFLFSVRLARLLLALALGLLLPLPGAIILVAGEVILVLRLFSRDQEGTATQHPLGLTACGAENAWRTGFRTAASKWGLAANMIIFAFTLQDRIAEIGAAGSFLVWLALNIRRPVGSDAPDPR